MHQTIVALYESRSAAERAGEDLLGAGLATVDLQLVSGDAQPATAEAGPREGSRDEGQRSHRNFFEWLFGSDVPENDVESYHSNVFDRGRTLLSVRAGESGLAAERVVEILERHDPIDIEQDQTGAGGPTAESAAMTDAGAAEMGGAGMAAAGTSAPAGTRPEAGVPEEVVVPTAQEELRVGKREVEGARTFRVRSYVVRRPVEEQVALREETVVVERRPPGAAAAPGQPEFAEKEVEVTERREEPVVSKVVRPGEDVVVRKDVKDRVETVRDAVRETKVDIDRAAAGDKPGSMPPGGAERTAAVPPAEAAPGEDLGAAPPPPDGDKRIP